MSEIAYLKYRGNKTCFSELKLQHWPSFVIAVFETILF